MQIKRFIESGQIPTNEVASAYEEVVSDPIADVMIQEVRVASIPDVLLVEFHHRYWTSIAALVDEMKNGVLNKDNVQEKMDLFVLTMEVE